MGIDEYRGWERRKGMSNRNYTAYNTISKQQNKLHLHMILDHILTRRKINKYKKI